VLPSSSPTVPRNDTRSGVHVPRSRGHPRGLPGPIIKPAFRLLSSVSEEVGASSTSNRPADRRAHADDPRARAFLCRRRQTTKRQGKAPWKVAVENRRRSTNACTHWRRRASSWRSHPAAAAHPVSTWICSEVVFLLGDRELLRGSSTGANPGKNRPYCLLDYFPDDFVCFIDVSPTNVCR